MPFVAILGAGPLGGALAYALASRGRFDEVRLIDPEKTLAAGKALDILQSGPVDGYSTRVKGSASLDEADGAWVAILADPINPDPLAHLAALHRRSPGAIVVCADAGHGVVMSRAVATGAVAPDRLIGAAPLAVASAARALIALDADLSPALVHVGVTRRDDTWGLPHRLVSHGHRRCRCRYRAAARTAASTRPASFCRVAAGPAHAGDRSRDAGRGRVVRRPADLPLLVGDRWRCRCTTRRGTEVCSGRPRTAGGVAWRRRRARAIWRGPLTC